MSRHKRTILSCLIVRRAWQSSCQNDLWAKHIYIVIHQMVRTIKFISFLLMQSMHFRLGRCSLLATRDSKRGVRSEKTLVTRAVKLVPKNRLWFFQVRAGCLYLSFACLIYWPLSCRQSRPFETKRPAPQKPRGVHRRCSSSPCERKFRRQLSGYNCVSTS